MWIDTKHTLSLTYDDFISESHMELRVEPRSTQHQIVRSFALAIGPPTRPHRYTDWNGNVVHHFDIGGYHDRIEIEARSLVETHPTALDLDSLGGRFQPGGSFGPLVEFLGFGGPVIDSDRLRSLADGLDAKRGSPVGAMLRATGELIRDQFTYVAGTSDSESTTEDLLHLKSGVCQDFAHLQIGLLRCLGIPARYVSGYLHLGTGEAAQSHAWTEVFDPDAGWVGYDATHTRPPNESYVVVAWGRDYDDVPPNRGVYRGSASERLEAAVHTVESQPHDIADLHGALSEIELPVYREVPDRSTSGKATSSLPLPDQQQQLSPPDQQQQQQQQQQQ